jgi:hypothetical protein
MHLGNHYRLLKKKKEKRKKKKEKKSGETNPAP